LKILVVEDTPKLSAAIREALMRANFVCDVALSMREAEDLLATTTHDLILLDLTLPDGDGLDVLRRLRAAQNHTPVIVLTARGGLNDRIAGLDDGADDYLVKPFELSEMVSRCRAVLRRIGAMGAEAIKVGKLTYDQRSGLVSAEGHSGQLPRRESQLLAALIRRSGKVCTRTHLEESLYESSADVTPNALEASIYRLRTFLTSADAGVEVRTVRGVGYVLVAAENA
jgi:DNA-binding response OmpR family regulator